MELEERVGEGLVRRLRGPAFRIEHSHDTRRRTKHLPHRSGHACQQVQGVQVVQNMEETKSMQDRLSGIVRGVQKIASAMYSFCSDIKMQLLK